MTAGRGPQGGGAAGGPGSRLGGDDVGRRVVVRHLLPDGRATDALGDLVALDLGTGDLVVVDAAGRTHDVRGADVVAAKAVPPRARRRPTVAELERVMARGWLPLESEPLGDWTLRAAEGFTSRANSVLPLGDPAMPLEDAVKRAERFYAARALPPRVALPAPLAGWEGDPLDALLAARGYAVLTPTVVLTAPAAAVVDAGDAAAVDLLPEPDEGWLGLYRYRGQELPPVARRVLTAGDEVVFASVRDRGRTVAVGRAAATGDWAGVTAMEVAAGHRRRGLGRAVLAALAGWAGASGATRLYLQVAEENAAGRGLYRRTGFTEHHRYRYRVARPGAVG